MFRLGGMLAHTPLHEFFLLRNAQRAAATLTPRQRGIVVGLVRAADRRLQSVATIVEPKTAAVALTLARDGVGHLVRAVVATRAPNIDDEAVRKLEPGSELRHITEQDDRPPNGVTDVISVLSSTDPLWADSLDRAEAQSIADALARTATWLRTRIEVRSETNIRFLRYGRVAALAVVALYVAFRAASLPNLALGKPVTQSSALPGAPPSKVLVDGSSWGMVGPGSADADYVHTTHEAEPWVKIDLLAAHTIQRVVVYNRNDTNFDDGLPFTLELSMDGDVFESAAQRTTHFGSTWFDRPWRVKLGGRRARFVRIRSKDYLALSEVEVFGR
jgi:hypothetical protein